jgi:Kef-type K+ transport system membrane component KefB
VLLGVEFPPTSAEWTFFVAAVVILVGPLLVERIGLPGIVGVILGGLLVGPFVLAWVERDGVVEDLGQLGILFLMFLAGLELDLDEFALNRSAALTFGAFTFTLPFVLGIALVLPFGYGLATAMLFGSLWASHTLVSYPIVQENGLVRERAVGIAGGGTVMTDTLALSVLAVVAGSVENDARPALLVLEVALGLAVLAIFCALILPRITRWVFAGVGQHRGARFLFILVALTASALIADRAGIEGIVGAFFAGLALNRLVPHRSKLMEQVEFVGGVLLIPFFLLSTGMLIDPKEFTHPRVLAIAALSLAVVFVGKAGAALLSGRVLGLGRAQVRLLFGLSLAQAAATLAAVTIGVQIGLFDTDLLNATLVVVLVTVLVSSIVTRSAARRIEPPQVQGERLAETIFVPSDVVDDPAVVRLAARLAMAKGGNVLVGAVAATRGPELAAARSRAEAAEASAVAVGAETNTAVRLDPSAADGLAAIVAEHEASLVVIGWRRAALAADIVLGGQSADLIALSEVPVLAVSAGESDFRRVILALDHQDLDTRRGAERDLAAAVAGIAAGAARGRVIVLAPDADAGREIGRLVDDDAEVVIDPRSRREALESILEADDLVLMPARLGASPFHRDAAAVASLPIGCSVGVPVRPRATAGFVHATATMVAGRAG